MTSRGGSGRPPAGSRPRTRRAIRALAADLPAVWQAATTTPAERQRIAMILIEHVSVTVDKASERVDVAVHWAGGLVESHTMSRPVKRYDLQVGLPATGRAAAGVVRRAAQRGGDRRAAQRGGLPAAEAGRSVHRGRWCRRLLWHLGLDRREPHGSLAGLGRDEYRPASLARRLGISRDTVRRWLRAGWLTARRDADGHHVIWADASELRRLRELHRLPRTWATGIAWRN